VICKAVILVGLTFGILVMLTVIPIHGSMRDTTTFALVGCLGVYLGWTQPMNNG
jgi:hypothetical protein